MVNYDNAAPRPSFLASSVRPGTFPEIRLWGLNSSGLPSDDDERAQEVARTVIEFATAGELDLVTLTDRVVQRELQRAQPGVPEPQ